MRIALILGSGALSDELVWAQDEARLAPSPSITLSASPGPPSTVCLPPIGSVMGAHEIGVSHGRVEGDRRPPSGDAELMRLVLHPSPSFAPPNWPHALNPVFTLPLGKPMIATRPLSDDEGVIDTGSLSLPPARLPPLPWALYPRQPHHPQCQTTPSLLS